MNDLTRGPITRRILAFAFPIILGNLFQQLYMFTDALIVGRLIGVEAFAAVGSTQSLHWLLIGFSIGACHGFAIPVAKAFGAGDHAALRKYAAAAVIVCGLVAVVLTVLGTIFSPAIISAMNTPAAILDHAILYFTVTAAGASATIAYNFLAGMLRALGNAKTPLYFLIGSSLLNAALVLLFVGVFNSGLGGVAATTIIAKAAAALGCVIYIWKRVPLLHLQRSDFRAIKSEAVEVARNGLPMGFQMSIIAIGALVLQAGVNGLGTDATAAFATAARVEKIGNMQLNALGVAMVTYVAQNRGAEQWRRIRQGVLRASLVATGIAGILGLVQVIFGRYLAIMLVGAEAIEVLDMAAQFFRVNGMLVFILGLMFIMRNTMQGLGIPSVPMLGGILELIVRAGFGLTLVGSIGFLAVSFSGPVAWFAALVPSAICWFVQRRKLIALEKDAARRARGTQPALIEETVELDQSNLIAVA